MSHEIVVGSGHSVGEPSGQYARFRRIQHTRDIEICEVSGELDLLTAPLLRQELAASAERGVAHLVIDMSRVEFCAVAGVEVLLQTCLRAQAEGRRVTVVAGRQVRRVVGIVGPTNVVEWAESVSHAVHAASEEVGTGGLPAMDLDSAQRGLRRYVEAVAAGLGVEAASTWSDVDDLTAAAYIALDGELPGFPGREVALVWDGRTGWALGAETHSGEDLMISAWYGTEPLPQPAAVVRFVEMVRNGRRVGLQRPSEPSANPHAARIVRARLQAGAWSGREPYLPEVAVPEQVVQAVPDSPAPQASPESDTAPQSRAAPVAPLRPEGVG